MNKIIPVVIVFVIVLAFYSQYNIHRQNYEEYLYGYWVADESFCEEADASSMMLFIGAPEKTSMFGRVTRPAHLIINNDITNQALTIKYKRPNMWFAQKMPKKYKIWANITFEEECNIPEDLWMEFNIYEGTMKMYLDEELYGAFYKDNEITKMFED